MSPAKREPERLRGYSESHKESLERFVRENEISAPGLAARARSVLLYLDGHYCEEIARVTGLSPNAVMRVRRRFASWGMPCLAEPEPSIPTRTVRPYNRKK